MNHLSRRQGRSRARELKQSRQINGIGFFTVKEEMPFLIPDFLSIGNGNPIQAAPLDRRSPSVSQSALGSSSQQALFIAVLGRLAQRLCEMSQKWHVQKDLISRLQTVQTNGQHSCKNIRTLTKPGSLWHRRWSVIRWPKRRAAWRGHSGGRHPRLIRFTTD